MQAARAPRIRVPGVAVAALLLLVVGVLSVAPALSTYLTQQRAVADAQARVTAQQAQLAGLGAQRARWDDPAYVRAQASSRLFYVTPGTTAYRVIHARATASGAATPAPTAVAAATPWTTTLLDSLVVAGTTTATPAELTR